MDDLVRQALAKWPDVPDCTGWLALDARGRWRVGDAKDGLRLPITHAAMIAFINRNYFASGRFWIFQNGPQRVFVELEYTPFVWRLQPGRVVDAEERWELVSQTGATMTPSSAWLDDEGRFLMQAQVEGGEPAIGVVHDHDTALVAGMLTDDDGDALDDDALSRLSSPAVADANALAAHVRWTGSGTKALRLLLHRIAAHQVPHLFGFEQKPSLALRVDLDTRR